MLVTAMLPPLAVARMRNRVPILVLVLVLVTPTLGTRQMKLRGLPQNHAWKECSVGFRSAQQVARLGVWRALSMVTTLVRNRPPPGRLLLRVAVPRSWALPLVHNGLFRNRWVRMSSRVILNRLWLSRSIWMGAVNACRSHSRN